MLVLSQDNIIYYPYNQTIQFTISRDSVNEIEDPNEMRGCCLPFY